MQLARRVRASPVYGPKAFRLVLPFACLQGEIQLMKPGINNELDLPQIVKIRIRTPSAASGYGE